jgi:2-polyprenyl-3-methyl-5-hydroxy-6-metoxy-1,4-benzoquinol methylase
MVAVPATCPRLARILESQLAVFPKHASYLETRYHRQDEAQYAFDEATAGQILAIAERGLGLRRYCEDYRFLTDIVLEEEIYFRRHRRYRMKSFAEAMAQVYTNADYMTRYMNGLLLTQLWWRNHAQVLRWYCERFIKPSRAGGAHLEIGPGHGLHLYLAATHGRPASLTAWDVNQSSLDLVRHALGALGYRGQLELELRSLFEAPGARFDTVTFSEVLEHLEDPEGAMRAVAGVLSRGGRAFVHAPVNSPAPDHLSLFRTPEEVVAIVAGAGLEVEDTLFAPTTTALSLEKARQREMAISVAVIARKRS